MWKCNRCSEEHEDSFEVCWNCGSSRDGAEASRFVRITENDDFNQSSGEIDYSFMEDMLLSTTPTLVTHEIKRYLGVVGGECLLGTNLINDMVSAVTNIVGGRSGIYEFYIKDARMVALREMAKQAFEMGANGVIGVAFDYETVRGSMIMVCCTGTGVILEQSI